MTRHIIEGVTSRAADFNRDGLVSMDELYEYVRRHVMDESPQEPERFLLHAQGDLVFAKTGALPRKEREAALRRTLFELAEKRTLSDAILTRGLRIANSEASALSGIERRLDELLDRLLKKEITVGEFVDQWYKAEYATVSVPRAPVLFERASTREEPSPIGPGIGYAFKATLPKHERGVLSVAFSPAGGYLATAAGDGTVRVFNVASSALLCEARGQGSPVWCIAYSPGGRYLACAGEDGCVRLYDTLTAAVLETLAGHGAPLVSLAISSSLIAAGGRDGRISVWDSSGRQCIRRFAANQGIINAVAFTPGGDAVASAGSYGTVCIWRTADWTPLKTLECHRGGVLCVTFSRDGLQFASSGRNALVSLWDASVWVRKSTLKKHVQPVFAIDFSADGRQLASAGRDGAINLWDTSECRLIDTAAAGHGSVQCIAFSPDGKLLASAGADQTVRLWMRRRPAKRPAALQ
jgi:WD40 repeat protein